MNRKLPICIFGFATLAALVRSAPVSPGLQAALVGGGGGGGPTDFEASITNWQNNIDPNGDYQFSYDTQNGIHFDESSVGKLVRDENNQEQLAPNKQGSFSWVAPDGVQYTVTYVADEFGFRPSGAHLPTPPPIPVEIQRALDYIKSVQPNRK